MSLTLRAHMTDDSLADLLAGLHESGSGSTFYGSSKEPGVGLRYLKNVSQPALEYIESIQHYKRLGEQDELWLLDELWNKDKHRALIVLDRPTWRDTFIISTANGRDLCDGEVKPNPTDDPDILLRLDSKSDSEVSFNPNPPLHVNFGEAGPLNGRAVVQVLVGATPVRDRNCVAGLGTVCLTEGGDRTQG